MSRYQIGKLYECIERGEQTDKQTDRQIIRQTDRQIHRQTNKETNRQISSDYLRKFSQKRKLFLQKIYHRNCWDALLTSLQV